MGDWDLDDARGELDDDELALRDNPHRRRIRRPPGVPRPPMAPLVDEREHEHDVSTVPSGQARARLGRAWVPNPLPEFGPLYFLGVGYAGPRNAAWHRQIIAAATMHGGELDKELTHENPKRVGAASQGYPLWFEWPRHTPFDQIQEWHFLFTFWDRNPDIARTRRNQVEDTLRRAFANTLVIWRDTSS